MEGSLINWLGFALTVGANLVTVAYMTGSVSARIAHLEKEMGGIEAELKEMRSLFPTLATIKAQLEMLGQNVNELKALVKKDTSHDA